MFQGLLRAKNTAAVTAHTKFSSSQDKAQFFRDIIVICRGPPGVSNMDESAFSSTVSSTGISPPPGIVIKEADLAPTPVKVIPSPPVVKVTTADVAPKELSTKMPPSAQNNTSTTSNGAMASSLQPQASDTAVKDKDMQKSKEKPVCSFFSSKGSCRKGKRCRFAHPSAQLQGGCWVPPDSAPAPAAAPVTDPSAETSLVTAQGSDKTGIAASTSVSSSVSAGVGSADLPRTNSVDNAMGLLDMDMQFLEENLDMRLEDKSPASLEDMQRDEPEGVYRFCPNDTPVCSYNHDLFSVCSSCRVQQALSRPDCRAP